MINKFPEEEFLFNKVVDLTDSIGHLRMFKKAKQLGDHLNVILNSDQFLLKKKGYKFMDFKKEERSSWVLSASMK